MWIRNKAEYDKITETAVKTLKSEGFDPYEDGNSYENGGWTYDTCMRIAANISLDNLVALLNFVNSDYHHYTDEWMRALKDTISNRFAEKIILGEDE